MKFGGNGLHVNIHHLTESFWFDIIISKLQAWCFSHRKVLPLGEWKRSVCRPPMQQHTPVSGPQYICACFSVYSSFTYFSLYLKNNTIFSLTAYTQSVLYAISHPSLCPVVHPSVTRMDQSKMVEIRIMQLSPQSSPIPLVFGGISLSQKFWLVPPPIPERGHQTRVCCGKQAIF